MVHINIKECLYTFSNSVALVENDEVTTYNSIVQTLEQLNDDTSQAIDDTAILDLSWSTKNITSLLRAMAEHKVIIPRKLVNQSNLDKLKTFNKIRNKNKSYIVLPTSGTEGAPKLVVQDLQQIAKRLTGPAKFKRIAAVTPLSTIGGIFTLFRALMSGATLCLYPDLKSQNLLKHIEQSAAELLPLSPTMLQLSLLNEETKTLQLKALKQINLGSEVAHLNAVNQFLALYPHVRFKHVYGCTETGLFYLSNGENNEDFSVDLNLSKNISINQSFLEIKTDTMMLGYLDDITSNNPQEQSKSFITCDIFRKSDLNRLRIIGRATQIVNIGGEKFTFDECEQALLSLSYVKFVKVEKEKQPLLGEFFKASIYAAVSGQELRSRIRADWARLNLNPKLMPLRIQSLSSAEIFTLDA